MKNCTNCSNLATNNKCRTLSAKNNELGYKMGEDGLKINKSVADSFYCKFFAQKTGSGPIKESKIGAIKFTDLLTEADEASEEKNIPASPLSSVVNRYITMLTAKNGGGIRPKVDGNVDFKRLWDAYVNQEDGADIQWRRLLSKGLGLEVKNINIRDNSPNQIRDRFLPALVSAFASKLDEMASADSTSVNAQVKFELIGVIYSLLIILKSGTYFNSARMEAEEILKKMVENNKEENLYGLEIIPRNVAGLEMKLQRLKDAKRV